jgi:Leucine Rich repeat
MDYHFSPLSVPELVACSKLDAKAFNALVDPTMETLEIVDCSGIPQDALANTIANLEGLRYLMLTHAGRVFGQKSVDSLLQSKAQLSCLSVSGAYLFKDADSERVINANPTLQSLTFDTCPLLGPKFVGAVAKTSGLLELALHELAIPPHALQELAKAADALQSIKNLTLRSMAGLTDELLTEILKATGRSLETLDVSNNHDLSDGCLSGIRQFNTRLRSLSMNGIKQLTSAGLLTFFSHPLEGLPPPPKLKHLELGSCDHEAVTDEVLEHATASASATYGMPSASFISGGRGLAQLDVQGSSLITDILLEKLVETSSNTLTELNVSYCPLITDKGLGYLVSRTGNQLACIHVWGCAQLSDEFFDGHHRADDRTLEIAGAWMKKNSMRSLR